MSEMEVLRHRQSPAFGLAVVFTVIAIFAGALTKVIQAFGSEGLLMTGFHRQLVMEALRSDVFFFALPILCVLPGSAVYLEDKKSGFYRPYLIRTSRKAYLSGKVFTCMLSGGLCLVAGIVLAFMLSKLVFGPVEVVADMSGEALESGVSGIGIDWSWVAEFFKTIFLIMLSGSFWAFVGMFLSAFTSSKYMAYGGPFIVYYVLIILCERYFPDCYVLYPKEWLNPDNIPYGCLGVFVICLELWILLYGIFRIREEGRLKGG